MLVMERGLREESACERTLWCVLFARAWFEHGVGSTFEACTWRFAFCCAVVSRVSSWRFGLYSLQPPLKISVCCSCAVSAARIASLMVRFFDAFVCLFFGHMCDENNSESFFMAAATVSREGSLQGLPCQWWFRWNGACVAVLTLIFLFTMCLLWFPQSWCIVFQAPVDWTLLWIPPLV